jgi:hypothetical protein
MLEKIQQERRRRKKTHGANRDQISYEENGNKNILLLKKI